MTLAMMFAGNFLNDFFVFDPSAMAWNDLSPSTNGAGPSARRSHGFTAAGGKLFVHAGLSSSFGNNGGNFPVFYYVCT
jgi:hypothetical protein